MIHYNKHKIIRLAQKMLPVAAIMLTSCYAPYTLQPTVYGNEILAPSSSDLNIEIGRESNARYLELENEMPARYKYSEIQTITKVNDRFTEERLNVLFDMAEDGMGMTYTPDGQYTPRAMQGDNVEVVVYKTYERKEALAWSKRMSSQGYAITVVYDEQKKMYTCTAKRKSK